MVGTPNNSVETTEVIANSYASTQKLEIPALEVKVKTDDNSAHTVSVVLTRDAGIRLYHQLNNLLFSR
jgi:hypothetical protein